MNITIKITHANGTCVDVSIPMGEQPAAVAPEVPAPEAPKDPKEVISTDCFGEPVTREDLKPTGERFASAQNMIDGKPIEKDLVGEEGLAFLKETIFGEPAAPAAPEPEPEAPAVDVGEQFRCVDGLYTITPSLYSDFCAAFGAPMVDRELVLARLWLETNPAKRKTKRGISRYLNAWLCRAQGEKRQPIKGRSGSLLGADNTSQEGW